MIQDYNANTPHLVQEVICVKCFHRYLAVYPVGTWLKELECETCGKGFIIATGQEIEE
jgi:hypothetical protein